MKKNTYFFILFSIVASGLNYAIYPLMSRVLPSNEYVNITVALSLFTQVSAFLSSIIAITIGISKQESSNAKEKIYALQSFLFKAFLVLAFALLLLSPFITNSTHIPLGFIVPIILMMLFSIPVSIISGYLNGINAMAKLGLVALVSASSQFTIALLVALLTHSGFFTMLTMTIAQLATIFIIYRMFSSLDLPDVISPLRSPTAKNPISKNLMIYTAFAAVSVMVISVAQIADLLISQHIQTTDAKFYTDIYVISRVVFFAGMILIWPFLGQIHLSALKKNLRPLIRLIGLFVTIGVAAIVGLLIGGDMITKILFGSIYDTHQIRVIGSLSIIFKVIMLSITAATLYFIVMHRYVAVVIAFVTSGALLLYGIFVNQTTDIAHILIQLNLIGGLIAFVAIGFVLIEIYREQ